MQSRNRIYGLDILKAFCITFIILLHTGALNNCLSINLDPLCRFAVPCFFMITGFFYHSSVNAKRDVSQIKKVIILILIANAVLIFLNIIDCLVSGNSVVDWLLSCFSTRKMIRLLLFNNGIIDGRFGSDHIWYLNALLYVLVIAFIFRKMGIYKVLYYLSPVILICGFVVECFSQQLFGLNFSAEASYCYYRNFLTVGIPYFCIGSFLRCFNMEKIIKYRFTILILSVILLCVSFVEFKIDLHFSFCTNGEFFILTPFYSIGIFLFFYSTFADKKPNKLFSFIALIGERYVVWIYLFHFPIIALIRVLFSCCGLPYVNLFVLSLLTLLLSLLVSVGVDGIIRSVKHR